MQRRPVNVLIVGGGFGGRYAAKRLAYRLPPGSRLTLLDRNDYLLYTPMLTEVAGGSVSADHIKAPNVSLPRRVEVIKDELQSADLATRTVTLASGRTISADHIVFALGSVTNYRHVEGAQEHSLSMKTLQDAQGARRMTQENVRRASAATSADERKRLLSFVVAGGGYTGVETIAALNDLATDTAAQVGISSRELQVTLIEPAKRLMAEMPEALATYGQERLSKDGIRVRTGIGVAKVEQDSLTLTNGETLDAGLFVWDTGIVPNPIIDSFACKKGEKGGIAVDSTFRVPEHRGVWAIGDCAEIPKPYASGSFFEPTAQNAIREGAHVADNILAYIAGRSLKPFVYKQIGELAVLSRYGGVANVYGVQVRGLLAWLMWRAIYVVKMIGMRQRLGILWDWIRLQFGRQYVPA